MKKGCLALAGMFLLFSCNQTKEGATAGTGDHMAMAKRDVENNKEILRAIETGDVSKLDSVMTKDVVDHEGNMGKDVAGIDSMKHYLGSMHNYFDGLKMEVVSEGTSLDNNYHFSLVHMKGKAKANPWGIPAGKEIDDMSVDVVKLKDGKTSEHWGFSSMKAMMEMMGGKMPAPARNDSL